MLRPARSMRRWMPPTKAFADLVAHHARRALGASAEARRRIEAEAEAFATLEALNCGKPRIRVLKDEMPAIADCFRFFAGAVRTMHGAVAGEYMAGHTSHDPPRPDRRDRLDRAVELSA